MIKEICAWCGNEIKVKEGEVEGGESHGICKSCLVKNFPDIAEKILGDEEVYIEREKHGIS